MKNTGIILIVVGIVMMFITGFNLVTEKKVADIGPVKIKKEENNPVHWPPIIGLSIIVAGAAVLLVNKNKT
jgi:hypothetical protein